tara:strand:+ start:584 stop:988 length:405 start_codon:yes stop_codon:yes gene_type:complete
MKWKKVLKQQGQPHQPQGQMTMPVHMANKVISGQPQNPNFPNPPNQPNQTNTMPTAGSTPQQVSFQNAVGAGAQGQRDGKINAIMQQIPNDIQQLNLGITDKNKGIQTANQLKTRLDELIRLWNQADTMPPPQQ